MAATALAGGRPQMSAPKRRSPRLERAPERISLRRTREASRGGGAESVAPEPDCLGWGPSWDPVWPGQVAPFAGLSFLLCKMGMTAVLPPPVVRGVKRFDDTDMQKGQHRRA